MKTPPSVWDHVSYVSQSHDVGRLPPWNIMADLPVFRMPLPLWFRWFFFPVHSLSKVFTVPHLEAEHFHCYVTRFLTSFTFDLHLSPEICSALRPFPWKSFWSWISGCVHAVSSGAQSNRLNLSALSLLLQINFRCKPSFRESGSRNIREVSHETITDWKCEDVGWFMWFVCVQPIVVRHHWVHRRRQEGKCKQCGKVCSYFYGLVLLSDDLKNPVNVWVLRFDLMIK